MAARDETHRNQYGLDIVFAVSCLAMLAAMLWMFTKDYQREFKRYQRKGADIEVAVLKSQAKELEDRNRARIEQAKKNLDDQLEKFGLKLPADTKPENLADRAKKIAAGAENPEIKELQSKLESKRAELVLLTVRVAAEKANRDALISQRDQLLRDLGPDEGAEAIKAKEQEVVRKNEEIGKLEGRLELLTAEATGYERQIAKLRKPLTDAVEEYERESREPDRLLRLADQKKIGPGAKFRAWPIIDAFNSPYKIKEHVPEGLLINYNFKEVQRTDRCASCHIFIDRGTPPDNTIGFDKESLRNLDSPTLKTSDISVYSHHPRLDLFVGSNSPHPVEKFGCTICHSGQGGSATFNFAYHSPDRGKTNGDEFESYLHKKDRWEKEHGWHASLHPDYLWDFPMTHARFVESSCLKCHHQVTDLIRTDGREEAPKVLKGYRLVRDLGCFGCHEISGYNRGRSVGPDLRLEPYPPLDDISPLERSKLTADANDPPGQLRKVGPGLRRVAEKTTHAWVANWLRSPRSFRPDTKMPHFWGQQNNTPHQLSDYQEGASQLPDDQKKFPDAEMDAASFYLVEASKSFLNHLHQVKQLPDAEWRQEQEAYREFLKLDERRRENPKLIPRQNDQVYVKDFPVVPLSKLKGAERDKLTKDQLAAVLNYFAERDRFRKMMDQLDAKNDKGEELFPYPPPELKDHTANPANGKSLFELRGCLGCHSHDAVKIYNGAGDLVSKADFGPTLSGLKEKLGNDRVKAEKWLYYWLTDPTTYHPRTKMPNPQLEPKDRADIAAWLLGEGSTPPDKDWKQHPVQSDLETMKKLAKVYLDKALPKSRALKAVDEGLEDVSDLRVDADERILAKKPPAESPLNELDQYGRLKYYVGRKTIGRYGCYACHDIPGFETAKPIGTPLNDWGRKESDRLAFDNIMEYLKRHHQIPGHGNGHEHAPTTPLSKAFATLNRPYEEFFIDALESHRRDGFLYQKLREPRSYDYEKLKERPWDDRLKMPQFKFAHTTRRQGESDEDYHARAAKEEDEALEAVMTFVLGLVGEPIPMKFVNQPKPDRLNEVKGLQVLEKYNCVGCHVLKPGGYEMPLDFVGPYNTESLRKQLEGRLGAKLTDLGKYPHFPEHSSWRSPAGLIKGKVILRGLPQMTDRNTFDPNKVTVNLWEAARFKLHTEDGEAVDYPSGFKGEVVVDPKWLQHGPYGGAFAEILARHLARISTPRRELSDEAFLLASGPPPLIREGQKVQPDWLREFLLHPHEIRPLVGKNLKMPRFNMTREEAEGLVKYFIAVDRLQNPGLGLDYFMTPPPERSPEYQERMRKDFLARIKELQASGQFKKDDKLDFDPQKADYYEMAWRIIANNEKYCLQCHNAGNLKAGGEASKPDNLGPNLDMTPSRIRPEYLERWIAVPSRLIPYTGMPAEIHDNVKPLADLLPELRKDHKPIPMEAVLPNGQDRVRAVRDALISWGVLVDPPPTAVKAGPPGNMHGGHQGHKGDMQR